MAQFKVTVDKPKWLEIIRLEHRKVSGAAVGALVQVANDAVKEGRAQIATSGRFGSPRRPTRGRDTWVTGLKARMRDAKGPEGPSLQAKAIVFHSVGLAGVFEHGATIQGKPLLWIPTTEGGPPASRSGKKLASATIRGQPVLFDANDPDRHKKPLYVGVPSVRIPKKWRITEIVEKHAARIGVEFLKRFQRRP